jgi:hypothetical protein
MSDVALALSDFCIFPFDRHSFRRSTLQSCRPRQRARRIQMPSRIGVTCALCHSTVNDALTKGIGNRLDGWPNRDLDVGAIVALSPSVKPYEQALGLDEATIRKVFRSWGPGRYDAELIHDGKAFRPDGKTAATLLPAAFGLSGVNLHTYTGWGSITHWNAYVANTQMHGRGTFFDPRLNDPVKFPVAQRTHTTSGTLRMK